MPAYSANSAHANPAVEAFREDVLLRFPYTASAREWLRDAIDFEVGDLSSVRGGGYWLPERNRVTLATAQYEAAIHELAHAWWHPRRIGQEEDLIQATIALTADSEARYRRLHELANGYIHGIPAQGWAGLLAERNDWEMYAGLASGMMADIRLVPPYIRRFYLSLFTLLPDDAPSPAATAPHG